MTTTLTYTEYLESKQSVDNRAINKDVLARLTREFSARQNLEIVEIGAGVGTMIARLSDWGFLRNAKYVLVDSDGHLLTHARTWLTKWARSKDYGIRDQVSDLVIETNGGQLVISFIVTDISSESQHMLGATYDLLIANAVLDLLDVTTALPKLFNLLRSNGCFWFTINFDGESIFVPPHPEDAYVLGFYHRSMDQRIRSGRPAGNSRTGRALFTDIPNSGGTLVAVGASDWIVAPIDANGNYPSQEQRFLGHILSTVEAELIKPEHQVDQSRLKDWLHARRDQVSRGALVYIAHQLDFLGTVLGADP